MIGCFILKPAIRFTREKCMINVATIEVYNSVFTLSDYDNILTPFTVRCWENLETIEKLKVL